MIEPPGSRRFLIITSCKASDGNFNLNDLPGSGDRMDVLADAVVSALLISNGIRRDTSIAICFVAGEGSGRCLLFSGKSIRYLNPDERSTAALIRHALLRSPKSLEGEAGPGIYFFTAGLREAIERLSDGSEIYYLSEKGERANSLVQPALFVLGDARGPNREQEDFLSQFKEISISPTVLMSSQCITVTHWILDNNYPQ
ncbi:MAG: hypothetical protein QXP70_02370 [Methanomassiliicoccales archaeon]